jgi:hypothetical protein
MRTALRHRTGTKAKGRAPDVMLERPGLREDTGQVRGEGKDPFPILGSLYAKRRLVRISRKDSKVPFSARSECTQRPGPPEGYPAFADPRPVRGGAMQEFSEVRAIMSRNSLHQILTTNVALGVWQKAECDSPPPRLV